MKTYEEVAEKMLKNLPKTAARFINYMRTRWGEPKDEEIKCQVGYAQEWAERFKMGIEYEMSDNEGKSILENMKLYN